MDKINKDHKHMILIIVLEQKIFLIDLNLNFIFDFSLLSILVFFLLSILFIMYINLTN